MPDSQCLSYKKYAVVTFIEENSVEVVPTIWLENKSEMKWPNTSSHSLITKLIRDCAPPSSSWNLLKIKLNSFSDSFSRAKRKASEAVYTSHLSSDSSDNASSKPRKKQKPARYQDSDSTDIDSECLVSTGKKFPIPTLPKSDERSCISSKSISNSQSVPSKERNDSLPNALYSQSLPSNKEQNDSLPNALYSQSLLSKEQNDSLPNALYIRLFQNMEKMNQRLKDLATKIDRLTSLVEKNQTTIDPALIHHLPEEVNLPLTCIEGLEEFNSRLRQDKHFAALMVRYLHNVASGKTPRSFILSITKKVLSQDVAVQFSRFGRKGKRSFQKYMETLNIILAAAALKHDLQREDLADMFGKSLAGASEWNKRKSRPSDNEECSLKFTDDVNNV